MSPSQLGSFSGEGGRAVLTRHESLTAPARPAYFAAPLESPTPRDLHLLDPVGPVGSVAAQPRSVFGSQRGGRYSELFATEGEGEEPLGERRFFSNGGRLSMEEPGEAEEMQLFQSARGFDDDAQFDFSRAPARNSFAWSHFGDRSGEEIDSIM